MQGVVRSRVVYRLLMVRHEHAGRVALHMVDRLGGLTYRRLGLR